MYPIIKIYGPNDVLLISTQDIKSANISTTLKDILDTAKGYLKLGESIDALKLYDARERIFPVDAIQSLETAQQRTYIALRDTCEEASFCLSPIQVLTLQSLIEQNAFNHVNSFVFYTTDIQVPDPTMYLDLHMKIQEPQYVGTFIISHKGISYESFQFSRFNNVLGSISAIYSEEEVTKYGPSYVKDMVTNFVDAIEHIVGGIGVIED